MLRIYGAVTSLLSSYIQVCQKYVSFQKKFFLLNENKMGGGGGGDYNMVYEYIMKTTRKSTK